MKPINTFFRAGISSSDFEELVNPLQQDRIIKFRLPNNACLSDAQLMIVGGLVKKCFSLRSIDLMNQKLSVLRLNEFMHLISQNIFLQKIQLPNLIELHDLAQSSGSSVPSKIGIKNRLAKNRLVRRMNKILQNDHETIIAPYSLSKRWGKKHDSRKIPKLLFLGGYSGKSTLCVQYVRGEFEEQYDWNSLMENYRKDVSVDGCELTVELQDVTGVEEYGSVRDGYIRESDAAVIVASVTSSDSFDELKRFVDRYKKIIEYDGKSRPFVLALTKADLEDQREVPRQAFADYAKSLGVPYFEVSAKTRQNVDKVFETLIRAYLRKPYPFYATVLKSQIKALVQQNKAISKFYRAYPLQYTESFNQALCSLSLHYQLILQSRKLSLLNAPIAKELTNHQSPLLIASIETKNISQKISKPDLTCLRFTLVGNETVGKKQLIEHSPLIKLNSLASSSILNGSEYTLDIHEYAVPINVDVYSHGSRKQAFFQQLVGYERFFQSSDGILAAYAIDSFDSLISVIHILKNILTLRKHDYVPIMLLGYMLDRSGHRQVSFDTASQLVKTFNKKYGMQAIVGLMECFATTGLHVEAAFSVLARQAIYANVLAEKLPSCSRSVVGNAPYQLAIFNKSAERDQKNDAFREKLTPAMEKNIHSFLEQVKNLESNVNRTLQRLKKSITENNHSIRNEIQQNKQQIVAIQQSFEQLQEELNALQGAAINTFIKAFDQFQECDLATKAEEAASALHNLFNKFLSKQYAISKEIETCRNDILHSKQANSRYDAFKQNLSLPSWQKRRDFFVELKVKLNAYLQAVNVLQSGSFELSTSTSVTALGMVAEVAKSLPLFFLAGLSLPLSGLFRALQFGEKRGKSKQHAAVARKLPVLFANEKVADNVAHELTIRWGRRIDGIVLGRLDSHKPWLSKPSIILANRVCEAMIGFIGSESLEIDQPLENQLVNHISVHEQHFFRSFVDTIVTPVVTTSSVVTSNNPALQVSMPTSTSTHLHRIQHLEQTNKALTNELQKTQQRVEGLEAQVSRLSLFLSKRGSSRSYDDSDEVSITPLEP